VPWPKSQPIPPDVNTAHCNVSRTTPYKPVQVWGDSKQAEACIAKIIQLFNQRTNFLDRPGQYDIDFVPAPGFLMSGNHAEDTSEVARHKRLERGHINCLTNMVMLSTYAIQNIDAAIMVDKPEGMISAPYIYTFAKHAKPETFPTKLTLREILLTLPFPLQDGGPTQEELLKKDPNGRKNPNRSDRLFHTVDLNSNASALSEKEQITFTCYPSRVHLASTFIAALPSFITQFYPKATDAWISPTHQLDDCNCDFIFDDSGTWTGHWTSPHDAIIASMMAADLFYVDSYATEVAETPDAEATANPFPDRPVVFDKHTNADSPALLPQHRPNNDQDSDADSAATFQSKNTTASMLTTTLSTQIESGPMLETHDMDTEDASDASVMTTDTALQETTTSPPPLDDASMDTAQPTPGSPSKDTGSILGSHREHQVESSDDDASLATTHSMLEQSPYQIQTNMDTPPPFECSSDESANTSFTNTSKLQAPPRLTPDTETLMPTYASVLTSSEQYNSPNTDQGSTPCVDDFPAFQSEAVARTEPYFGPRPGEEDSDKDTDMSADHDSITHSRPKPAKPKPARAKRQMAKKAQKRAKRNRDTEPPAPTTRTRSSWMRPGTTPPGDGAPPVNEY
jgi:hypothetical protein